MSSAGTPEGGSATEAGQVDTAARALIHESTSIEEARSLEAAVEQCRQALASCPKGHPDRSVLTLSLADALQTQFGDVGGVHILAEAVDLYRQDLDLCPIGHPDHSISLENLANSLWTLFGQLGNLDLLAEAVELHRQALELRPLGHPDRWSSLNNLANSVATLCEQLGDLDMLAEAGDLHRQALDLCPLGHPDRLLSLSNLATTLLTLFEQLGDLDVLAEAIDLHREALDLCLLGHVHRASTLDNLANSLHTQFKQLGDIDSLAEAVDLHRQALDMRPLGHSDRLLSLTNLAMSVSTRSQQLGDLDLLAEAITLQRQALDLCSLGHPHRSSSLNNLATSLLIRFRQLGDLDSLVEAAILHQQALDLRPLGHPHRSGSLSNLASSLLILFRQFGDRDSFTEAVNLHRQALDLRPVGHPLRSISLSNLANSLHAQFEQPGDLDSLAEAVDLHRQALDLRPLGHPDRPSSLINLRVALRDLSVARGQSRNLQEELDVANDGLQCCGDGHPMRAYFLFDVAECVLQPGTSLFALEKGIQHAEEGLKYRVLSARERLRYAIRTLSQIEVATQLQFTDLINAHISQSQSDDMIMQIYTLVNQLLPLVASFGLDHTDRLLALSQAEGVSRDAAARAIRSGRATEAVEMLEEGRGVFWSQALKARATDLDILPVEDAEKLRVWLNTLESPNKFEDVTNVAQLERQLEQRRKLGEAAEALIANIRTRPGMDRFLLPPAFESFVQALPAGFVVMLNVSKLGNYALVVNGRAQSVHTLSLRLPARVVGMGHTKRGQKSSRDQRIEEDRIFEVASGECDTQNHEEERDRAGIRELATFEDSLADMWVCIVKPIIGLLGLKKQSGRERPRVWWCATGSLTFLPIHAAGGYSKSARERSGASAECASDYIVSSYTPSILALVRASSTPRSMPRSQVKGLLVHEGNPGRGWQTIPKVKDEVHLVKECFEVTGAPITVVNETSVHPTVPEILTCLEKSDIHVLHLACHGAQRPDPLASAFILRDEDLSIQELMKLELKHASMAFLSACQTAKGDKDQPDQAVHLAASLLFCGFKSVIATMWSMSDVDGPVVAGSVYKTLFREEVFDLDAVPYALDDAVQRLREEKVEARRWAVFLHMGA